MPIESFQINPGMTTGELCGKLYERGLDEDQCNEVIWCYVSLLNWPEKFAHLGQLISIDHLSGESDPPDVVAHFSSGQMLAMEHTSVEPGHRHWAKSITGDECARAILSVSGEYKSREAIITDSSLYGAGPWASVSNERGARVKLILRAMVKKISKYPLGGVLVMHAACHQNDLELKEAIRIACDIITTVPGWEKWTFVFSDRFNSVDFYSTIFSKEIPFEERF